MNGMVPVSVIVITKNEQRRLARCLEAIKVFKDVHVVDSGSTDNTVQIARNHGAQVTDFSWNGNYPRKKQWAIDNVDLKYDWVFLVDADEVLTPTLEKEIQKAFSGDMSDVAGFFVKGQTVYKDKAMRYGLHNKKLCLFHKDRMMFPNTGEGDLEGMGDMEGHYQPVLKDGFESFEIGKVNASLLHYCYESDKAWRTRHERYAVWEHGMNKGGYWPKDPVPWRQTLKQIFRKAPMRGAVAFIHCYMFRLGFLEGRAGFKLAKGRYDYYKMIACLDKTECLQSP